jgi:tetratricopeptide (TPR) repeat protein
MTKSEFSRKTTKIRQYPHHLKYTLFANEKIKSLREKEFIFVFYTFDEIKEKGNKLFKRGKFKEALENYMEAYSLLKWIEFKDRNKNNYFYSKLIREEIPILDDDIVEKNSRDLNFNIEEDSYRFCIVNILLCMSYCYIELRHYSSAIDCLNECVSYCEDHDNYPDVYLRRSQARTYNKYSDDAQLALALADMQKAISLSAKGGNRIYNEHYNILMKLIQTRKTVEKDKIKSKKTNNCLNSITN